MERRRFSDRFFEGFVKEHVPGKDGKRGKNVYVYRGPYYTLNLPEAEVGRRKALFAALTAGYVAVFFYIALLDIGATRESFAAVLQLAALLPMLYLLVGLAGFLACRGQLMIRETHAVTRIRRSALGSLVLLGAAVLADVVYLLRSGSPAAMEWLYLAGLALCCVLLAALWRLAEALDFVETGA